MSDAQARANRGPCLEHAVAADVLVMRCFAAVDLPELRTDLFREITGLPHSLVADTLRDLAVAGALVATRPGWYRAATGSARFASAAGDDITVDLRRRFVGYVLSMVDKAATALQVDLQGLAAERADQSVVPIAFLTPSAAQAWLADNVTVCLAGVKAAAGDQYLHAAGHRLARMLWRVLPVVAPDTVRPDWRGELARWGELAAISGRDPSALAVLLDSSAHAAMDKADFRFAEAQWVRASNVQHRLGDRAGLIRVLRSLAEMYRSWGRWHRALDMAFELLLECQRNQHDRAGALAEVGTTMLGANRPDSAADYLEQAVAAFQRLDQPVPVEHAGALVSWGRALWQQGAWRPARRRFSAALALLVEVDDALASQVRVLLRQPDGQPLPDGFR